MQHVISQPPKSRWACPKCKCLTVHMKTVNGFVCVECGSPLAPTESEKRAYYQRPDVKEKQRAYRQRPDVKEKQRAYYQRPDVKEKKRAYRQRPDVKEKKRAYRQRPDVKEKKRAYMRQWAERRREKLRKMKEDLVMEVSAP